MMQLNHIHLLTKALDPLHRFYRDRLGLPIESSTEEAFTIRAGASRLTFRQAALSAYYHFAFNIPSNQGREALKWLRDRVNILKDGPHELIHFVNWNAQAVYFRDPAGNIVEFIARKNLGINHPGPFDPKSILEISEIGLPVREVAATFLRLHRELGVEQYWGDLKEFCAAGGEHGLFIIVDYSSKTWYPTNAAAKPFPLTIDFRIRNQPYRLTAVEQPQDDPFSLEKLN